MKDITAQMAECSSSEPLSMEKTSLELNEVVQEQQNHETSTAESVETATSEDTDQWDYSERWRIRKNLFLISFSFLLLFSAFQSLSNLQSSVNLEQSMGTNSLSCIYLALIFSCLFVPSLAMKHLTCKWTMTVSMLCYTLYIAAQYHPNIHTMVPSALVVGLAAAPLWAAKCTYLTQMGLVYARITRQPIETVIVRFFGLFFLLFQISQVVGNFTLYLLLKPEDAKNTTVQNCGADFCHKDEEENMALQKPSESQTFALVSVFLCLAGLAALVIGFLVDSLERYGEKEMYNSKTEIRPLELITATVRHMKKPYQLLIIPLTVFSGLEQAYITADFSESFISCSKGVHWIGLVMIANGLTDAIVSFLLGFVIKHLGRVMIVVGGFTINMCMIITMLLYTPVEDKTSMLFLIASLWGAADAVWQTQINAFYGVIFPYSTEAAFSNYRLWESLGFAIGFSYSGHLCTVTKLYILLVASIVGLIGYLVIEILERRPKNNAELQE